MSTATVKTKNKLRTLDMVYVSMFSALMMIGANITSFIPFMTIGGVPITLQTFFAVLAGAFLGSRLGAISMAVYMFIGLAGAPVFAKFMGGPTQILSSTFGFILSFIVTAYVTGKIIEKSNKLHSYIIAALIGTLLSYLIGTNLMYLAYKVWVQAPAAFSYKVAWMWMAVPFPKDIFLAVLAGMFAHRMQNIVKRSR
ncbi:biotin transporter BioY [Lederbergia wuyishanensis]|uniref:Biotin transporter n=1 Tax=Lederbergia wuyishanensis TaxID=1347903 RepID=A0ABU0D3V9_9BACI|nr:biotin transporter BioY [Lederbergia wuyishanensis]MCJ8007752.1 biotin transporter BioY [Lederbergia wuyishanensis]MDQ0343085.1 biotin transport system substrate-specific component [Lederbergia wuyishanensis]